MLISQSTINKSSIQAIIPYNRNALQTYQHQQQFALEHEKHMLQSGLPLEGSTVRTYQRGPDGKWYIQNSDARINVHRTANPLSTINEMERIQLSVLAMPTATVKEYNAAREAATIAREARIQLQKEVQQKSNPYRSYLQLFSTA